MSHSHTTSTSTHHSHPHAKPPHPAAHAPSHAHPKPHAPAAPVERAVPASGITFASLALCEPLQQALAHKNYVEPSPIQAQAIPHLLEGRDLIGCAQTGTGKTAAFALPILQHLSTHPKPHQPRRPRVLVLAPTRELAAQIGQSFADYGKNLRISHTTVFGGVGMAPQVRALSRGVDVVVATPGRLADLEKQRHISLDAVEVFVLDEADRMLDQGFIHEIRRIIKKLPEKRQSLLFSATMPKEIEELAASIVRNPVRVAVVPESTTAERVDQHVCFVDTADKMKLLVHTLKSHQDGLALVFVRMKHMANRIAEQLEKNGIPAEAIHGNKSQGARVRALENFRAGRKRVMIATDIAARGIDVKGITLVINFNLPEEPEAYVHRIGRTARAGKDGRAIAFCDRTERGLLRTIERVIRQPIPVMRDQPFAPTAHTPAQHDALVDNRQRPSDDTFQTERGHGGHRGGHSSHPRGGQSARPEMAGGRRRSFGFGRSRGQGGGGAGGRSRFGGSRSSR